jgi:hypothetical protein
MAILLGGCASIRYQTHRLDVPASGAVYTFPGIARVATGMGHQVVRYDDSVHVQLDERTWIYYTIQLNEYNLVIQLDTEGLSPSAQSATFDSAKTKAHQIFTLARK